MFVMRAASVVGLCDCIQCIDTHQSFMSPSDVLYFKLKHVGVCRILDPADTWQDARH